MIVCYLLYIYVCLHAYSLMLTTLKAEEMPALDIAVQTANLTNRLSS